MFRLVIAMEMLYTLKRMFRRSDLGYLEEFSSSADTSASACECHGLLVLVRERKGEGGEREEGRDGSAMVYQVLASPCKS